MSDDESIQHFLVLATPDCPHLDCIAALLHTQWPRGGSIQDYLFKITSDSDEPPCSYILLNHHKQDKIVPVGHVRITECLDESSVRAVAATYVVTTPQNRGYGRVLMNLLEQIVLQTNKYHYIYVWTHTAFKFYRKCGYSVTTKVSLHRPCLKRLESKQVMNMESLFKSRLQNLINPNNNESEHPVNNNVTERRQCETVLLPPDAATEETVWLRKRLVESVPLVTVTSEDRRSELHAVMQKHPTYKTWKYHLCNLPWSRQIGPSCGLAALRMVQANAVPTNDLAQTTAPSLPSLLDYAVQNGYSHDGELFNVLHLVDVAQTVCNLVCRIESVRALSPGDVLSHLLHNRLMIFAYDSQPITRQPCLNGGSTAHYGVIVGLLLGRTIDNTSEAPATIDEITLGEGDTAEDFFESTSLCLVLVQHGLSSKLTIAPWADFVASNQQLRQADVNKYPDASELNLSDHLIVIG
jgi:GNAT superfamily N-acetyltransferase